VLDVSATALAHTEPTQLVRSGAGAVIAHAGADWDQIISASFIQSTGLYGVPPDVAATYIIVTSAAGNHSSLAPSRPFVR